MKHPIDMMILIGADQQSWNENPEDQDNL